METANPLRSRILAAAAFAAVLTFSPLRAHAASKEIIELQTQVQQLLDMVQRVFDGSSSQLVLHALGSQRASREELRAIRSLLNKLDKDAP